MRSIEASEANWEEHLIHTVPLEYSAVQTSFNRLTDWRIPDELLAAFDVEHPSLNWQQTLSSRKFEVIFSASQLGSHDLNRADIAITLWKYHDPKRPISDIFVAGVVNDSNGKKRPIGLQYSAFDGIISGFDIVIPRAEISYPETYEQAFMNSRWNPPFDASGNMGRKMIATSTALPFDKLAFIRSHDPRNQHRLGVETSPLFFNEYFTSPELRIDVNKKVTTFSNVGKNGFTISVPSSLTF